MGFFKDVAHIMGQLCINMAEFSNPEDKEEMTADEYKYYRSHMDEELKRLATCPYCGTYEEFHFRDFEWERNQTGNGTKQRKRRRYVCSKCGEGWASKWEPWTDSSGGKSHIKVI